MNARPAAHESVVPHLDAHASDFAAHHVVNGAALDFSGEARHHHVASRFQRDVAEIALTVCFQRHDSVLAPLEVRRPVVVERRVSDRLPGIRIDDRS